MSQEEAEPEAPPDEGEDAPEELLERLQYLQAEFENYRKRIEREREESQRVSQLALVRQLLPTLDSFDSALDALDNDARDGMVRVYDGLVRALESVGLKEIPANGQPYDPYLHEVSGFAPGPGVDDGNIVEVVQKGYTFQSKVVRPSKVIVLQRGGEDE